MGNKLKAQLANKNEQNKKNEGKLGFVPFLHTTKKISPKKYLRNKFKNKFK